MRPTVPLAACLTVLVGCGAGDGGPGSGEVAAGTTAPAPVADVGDTVAFTDRAGRTATLTLDGLRRLERADSSELVADVTVAAAGRAVPVDADRFRARAVPGPDDPGGGAAGRPVEGGIAFPVPHGEVVVSYLDPDGEVLVAFRIDPADQVPEEEEFVYPPFSCDMGVDGIPVCEGDVPDSVGVYRTPDGDLVGG